MDSYAALVLAVLVTIFCIGLFTKVAFLIIASAIIAIVIEYKPNKGNGDDM